MDEPCSALDADGTAAIEQLMRRAARASTRSSIVTHNMAQARRTSDECIFMLLGEVIEQGATLDMFLTPRSGNRDVCRGPVRLEGAAVKRFEPELAALKQRLLEMGTLAEDMVASASNALLTADVGLDRAGARRRDRRWIGFRSTSIARRSG